jgi:NADPH:quinone reductase-like Zn-dependent oxidoreductase
MQTMKAVRMHDYGSIDSLVYEDVAQPVPAADDLLIKVRAAGVNPVDWKIVEGFGKGWLGHGLPHILGCDFAGVVEAMGSAVTRFKAGDAVYGYTSMAREGTYAEYVIAKESEIAAKPEALDFAEAAALPVATLTASQALFGLAGLAAGQKVLIHGAAGGVGSMAVQLAKAQGAYVIGTASARNAEFVKDLGADEVVDYTTTKFEEVVKDLDVVFDLIGGDTQQRSYAVLKKGGFLVAASQPPDETTAKSYGIRAAMVGTQPSGAKLEEVNALVEAGKIKTFVEKLFPLSEAQAALELSKQGRTRGKIILRPE